jgi:type II secretory pathway component PulF
VIPTTSQLKRRAELYHQLSSMIAAGVPLIQALEMSANNSTLRSSRKFILDIIQHLKNGLSFGDAMLQVHGWLPDFDTALLSAGEQSGKLDFSFKALGDYYAARAEIIRETISNLTVAALNLHVFLLVFPLSLLIKLALGILNNDHSQGIPFITEKIIVYGLLWGTILFFLFACQGKRGERWRSVLEHLNQLVPMLRTALKYLVLYRFTTALDALVNSGISIVKGLPMAAAASGSPHLKKTIAEWPRQLEGGTTPSELIRAHSYFPEMYANLYHTGEISGHLDDTLKRLQTYYHEEGFRLLRLFARILSRIIYFMIAIMIAYNVIEFYLGYFRGIGNMLGNGN